TPRTPGATWDDLMTSGQACENITRTSGPPQVSNTTSWEPGLRGISLHTPTSVNGRELAPREAWRCYDCHIRANSYAESRKKEEDRILNGKLEREKVRDKEGRERWTIELERRKKKNLASKK
ncbi:MAG: hypothetical protein Q8O94_01150, partial [bacterium]|nr:hypothetical protein [bacterium]